MTRSLPIYIGFGLAGVVVIFTFVTATTYTQLALASLLYPPLLFFAYKFLPIGKIGPSRKASARISHPIHHQEKSAGSGRENLVISDLDKRAFLKLIGSTGLAFFLVSIFGRRVESLIFGQNNLQPALTGNPPPGGQTDSVPTSPTDGYTIAEIDDNIIGYYGFIDKQGGWFIMQQDSASGSFRYVKGNSDFPGNWKNHQNLKYDYFNKVFF